MSQSRNPTLKTSDVRMVLVAASSPSFVRRCQEVAVVFGASAKGCPLEGISTAAAETRPLVIVMPEVVYGFDRRELDALAVDVGARIVTFEAEDVPLHELSLLIRSSAESAERLRR